MATIVRVKRRRNEEPVDLLLVSCKKAKKDTEKSTSTTEDEPRDILKFAGTLTTKTDGVSRPVREAIRKEKLEKEYKRHTCDVTNRARQQIKQSSADNRYKITSKHRTLEIEKLDIVDKSDSSCENDEKQEGHEKKSVKSQATHEVVGEKVFRLLDVEKDHADKVKNENCQLSDDSRITCNSVPMVREACSGDGDYVYDLYYTNNRDFNFRLLEDMLRIEVYIEDFFDKGVLSDEEVCDGSDDSNDESNWRNDYPDEDPHFFENDAAGLSFDLYDNDMTFGIDGPLAEYMSSRCNIEDGEAEHELSSDEEDSAYPGEPFNPLYLGQQSYGSYLKKVRKEFQEYKNNEKKVDTND